MTNQRARLAGSLILFCFSAAAALFSSCSTVTRTITAPPEIEGAHFVGNAACADCHTNYTRAFAASPHARFHSDDLKMAGQSGCESCHGPGSKHVEKPGRGKFIVNPGKDATACFNCHLQTHAEFKLPHHHPVVEGRLNCVQCHDPHGSDIKKTSGGLALGRQNETCAACHRDQARRFIFEHEALREGCTTCHNPHGSFNPKLLTQRDPNLCLRCHAQVQDPALGAGAIYIGSTDHSDFIRRATCWAAGCHTALHGSNVDVKLRY
jgi:predicted CXXCH cytochrome family protein